MNIYLICFLSGYFTKIILNVFKTFKINKSSVDIPKDDVPNDNTNVVIYYDGTEEWWEEDFLIKKIWRKDNVSKEIIKEEKYENNKHHREDGPTVEHSNDTKHWYIDDKLNREDRPTVECDNGHKEWRLHGKLHRENGPAMECYDGSKYWYIDGKRHRVGGPAIEYSNGHKEWWLNGKKIKDINLPIKDEHSFMIAVQTVWVCWPDAVFKNGITGKTHNKFSQIPFGDIKEIFIYRNKKIADRWNKEGAVPSLSNTMIHLIYDYDMLTIVIDKINSEIELLIGAIKASLTESF